MSKLILNTEESIIFNRLYINFTSNSSPMKVNHQEKRFFKNRYYNILNDADFVLYN